MNFAADVASEIARQRGHVTKLLVEEGDPPQYLHCYHIRVEDGVRYAEYWVDRFDHERGTGPGIASFVEYLLHRLKTGDPVKTHLPQRSR